MQEIAKFKIRCSAIGQIMTNAKGAVTEKQKEEYEKLRIKDNLTIIQQDKLNDLYEKIHSSEVLLSDTTKTYCENWLKEKLFDRKKEFSSKQTEKGINVEQDGIDFLVENSFIGEFCTKNENNFSNHFMNGTPDVLDGKFLVDLKCSWDLFTFPLFETKINKAYWWQLQGYMHLTGLKKAKLIYCLINTPYDILEKELYYATKDLELTIPEMERIEKGVIKNHVFNDIAVNNKIKMFEFDYDANCIELIEKRVIECRTYIYNLLKKM